MMNRILLIFGSVVVLSSLALQFIPPPDHTGPSKGSHLSDTLPTDLPGWNVEDQELGETEAVRAAADKQLQLDDFVYRTYQKGAFLLTYIWLIGDQERCPSRW